jgi:hypothetical protein
MRLNVCSYHEVLDRISIIECMINDHLLEHDVVVAEPELRALLRSAEVSICDAYQLCANIRFSKFEEVGK